MLGGMLARGAVRFALAGNTKLARSDEASPPSARLQHCHRALRRYRIARDSLAPSSLLLRFAIRLGSRANRRVTRVWINASVNSAAASSATGEPEACTTCRVISAVPGCRSVPCKYQPALAFLFFLVSSQGGKLFSVLALTKKKRQLLVFFHLPLPNRSCVHFFCLAVTRHHCLPTRRGQSSLSRLF